MAFTNIYGKDFLTIFSLENSLMLGKNESRKRRGHQRMRWLYGITDAMDMNLDKLRKMVKEREVWRGRGRFGMIESVGSQRVRRHDWVTNQQQQFPNSFFLFFFLSNKNYLPEVCISRDGSGFLEKTRQNIYISEAQRKVLSFSEKGFCFLNPDF